MTYYVTAATHVKNIFVARFGIRILNITWLGYILIFAINCIKILRIITITSSPYYVNESSK